LDQHESFHLAIHEDGETVVTDIPDRNLSLRVPISTHVMLHRLAQKLGRSKTACAEEIITNAVKDVYQQFDLPALRTEDLEKYAAQSDKSSGDKAG